MSFEADKERICFGLCFAIDLAIDCKYIQHINPESWNLSCQYGLSEKWSAITDSITCPNIFLMIGENLKVVNDLQSFVEICSDIWSNLPLIE